jgi:hypothetical protein
MGVVAENSLIQAAFLGAAASGSSGGRGPSQQASNSTSYSDFGAAASEASRHPQGSGTAPAPGQSQAAAGSSQQDRPQGGCVQFMWPVQLKSLQLPPTRSATTGGGGAIHSTGNELAKLELKVLCACRAVTMLC